MKKLFFISLLLFTFYKSNAQLKSENFLFIDSSKYKIIANKGIDLKGFTIYDSGFKYEKDLSFYYARSFGSIYCCNYYEVKETPKEWNIITVKDVVAHMEDKCAGFRFNEKKLFFVEYDRERRIYKAYQVDIIGWPRTD